MSQAAKAREQDRKARARLRVLHHCEQVTRNVSQTCRFFGISRSLFYIWRGRYRQDGLVGLRDGPRGPRHHPFTTPTHIVARILQVRWQRQYGPLRISLFLQRYHQFYVSAPTIQRILKRHRVPLEESVVRRWDPKRLEKENRPSPFLFRSGWNRAKCKYQRLCDHRQSTPSAGASSSSPPARGSACKSSPAFPALAH